MSIDETSRDPDTIVVKVAAVVVRLRLSVAVDWFHAVFRQRCGACRRRFRDRGAGLLLQLDRLVPDTPHYRRVGVVQSVDDAGTAGQTQQDPYTQRYFVHVRGNCIHIVVVCRLVSCTHDTSTALDVLIHEAQLEGPRDALC